MEGGNYLIDLGDLLARFCLSFVFLWSGVSKAFHPAAGKAEIAALGLPYPALFLPLTVACQIGGGLMGLLGAARSGCVARLHRGCDPFGARNPRIDRREAPTTGDDGLRTSGNRGWLSVCGHPWRWPIERG